MLDPLMFQSTPPAEAEGDGSCAAMGIGVQRFNPLPPPRRRETSVHHHTPRAI